MNYWLAKSEPGTYAWATLVRDGKTAWTGVRNFAARNNLRAMTVGDLVFFYHSGEEKSVVGVARVAKAAYPDPTADEGDWSAVDLTPVKSLGRPGYACGHQGGQNPPGNEAGQTTTFVRDPGHQWTIRPLARTRENKGLRGTSGHNSAGCLPVLRNNRPDQTGAAPATGTGGRDL